MGTPDDDGTPGIFAPRATGITTRRKAELSKRNRKSSAGRGMGDWQGQLWLYWWLLVGGVGSVLLLFVFGASSVLLSPQPCLPALTLALCSFCLQAHKRPPAA